MLFYRVSIFSWCKFTKLYLNEQSKCKTRPQTVNVNENDPVFFPFSIKTYAAVVAAITIIHMQN